MKRPAEAGLFICGADGLLLHPVLVLVVGHLVLFHLVFLHLVLLSFFMLSFFISFFILSLLIESFFILRKSGAAAGARPQYCYGMGTVPDAKLGRGAKRARRQEPDPVPDAFWFPDCDRYSDRRKFRMCC
jgi:hypothetical protein